MTRWLLARVAPAAWYARRPRCGWTHPWHPATRCRRPRHHRTPHRFRWAHGGTANWTDPKETP